MLPFLKVSKLLLLGGLCSGAASSALAMVPQQPAHKLAPDLANPRTSSVSVIIQYKTVPTDAELAQLVSLGGSTPVVLKSINAVQVNLPSSAVSNLTSDDNVLYITPDRRLATHAVAPPPAPAPTPAPAPGSNTLTSIATSPEFTAEPINAGAAWNMGYQGTGIGVAVIDSGINPQRDLQAVAFNAGTMTAPAPAKPSKLSRVVYSACFLPNCANDTTDDYGHGTHVAGLIGGNGTASTGPQYSRTFYGIAPNVNLINLKVLDSNGQGTDTAVIQAIEAAISL